MLFSLYTVKYYRFQIFIYNILLLFTFMDRMKRLFTTTRHENTNFLLDFNVVVINAICIVDVISNNKLAWYRQSFQTRIIVCYIGKQYSHCHKRCVPLYRFPVLIPFLDCSDITSCVNVTQEHVSKVTWIIWKAPKYTNNWCFLLP